MATDRPLATGISYGIRLVDPKGLPCARFKNQCGGTSAIEINSIMRPDRLQPLRGFKQTRTIAVAWLAPVDGDEKQVPSILRKACDGPWVEIELCAEIRSAHKNCGVASHGGENALGARRGPVGANER